MDDEQFTQEEQDRESMYGKVLSGARITIEGHMVKAVLEDGLPRSHKVTIECDEADAFAWMWDNITSGVTKETKPFQGFTK